MSLVSLDENRILQSALLQKEKFNSRNLEFEELLKRLSIKKWNLEKELLAKERVIESQIRNLSLVKQQGSNLLIYLRKSKIYIFSWFRKLIEKLLSP